MINKTQEIDAYMINSEAELRGYVISEKASYLQPFHENINKISPAIRDLKRTITDNPEQINRVDSLLKYADLKVSDMRELLALFNSKGFESSKNYISLDKGKFFKDKMLEISNEIIKT